MLLLWVFAFLSGLITITAPCIWPLLPVVLGGAQKPAKLIIGLTTSFFLSTLLLSSIVKIIPLNATYLRYFAIIIIGFSGLSLLIPKLADAVEITLSKVTNKFNPTGNGGLITGIALGLVWAPCAGPILATVIALAATQKLTVETVIILLAYTMGLAISLWIFTKIGKRFIKNTHLVQKVFGLIMLVTAVAMFFNLDTLLSARLLDAFPSYTNLTEKIETIPLKKTTSLGRAPEFVGISNWINSEPLNINKLQGKVVLVDFWTYTCINCIRTLPYVTNWYEKYKDQGFVVVGVHTPEFEFEKDTANVQAAIKRYKINYPVAQDNGYATWNNYRNQYWPAHYLIDAEGNVRYTHFGEGQYEETEKMIQQLLQESGKQVESSISNLTADSTSGRTTPETYLGSARGGAPYVKLNANWITTPEYIESKGDAVLNIDFSAKKVFLVITPNTKETVKVFLDDVAQPDVVLDEPRLYQILSLPQSESHKLRLEFKSPGTKAFAFTFG